MWIFLAHRTGCVLHCDIKASVVWLCHSVAVFWHTEQAVCWSMVDGAGRGTVPGRSMAQMSRNLLGTQIVHLVYGLLFAIIVVFCSEHISLSLCTQYTLISKPGSTCTIRITSDGTDPHFNKYLKRFLSRNTNWRRLIDPHSSKGRQARQSTTPHTTKESTATNYCLCQK